MGHAGRLELHYRYSVGDDVAVTDMMRPKKDLMSLDINELEGSSIGEVIDALKDSGQQHCLVVDRGTNKVRGIFSASAISRMLPA